MPYIASCTTAKTYCARKQRLVLGNVWQYSTTLPDWNHIDGVASVQNVGVLYFLMKQSICTRLIIMMREGSQLWAASPTISATATLVQEKGIQFLQVSGEGHKFRELTETAVLVLLILKFN